MQLSSFWLEVALHEKIIQKTSREKNLNKEFFDKKNPV